MQGHGRRQAALDLLIKSQPFLYIGSPPQTQF